MAIGILNGVKVSRICSVCCNAVQATSCLYLLETTLVAAFEVAEKVCFSAASAASRTLSATLDWNRNREVKMMLLAQMVI